MKRVKTATLISAMILAMACTGCSGNKYESAVDGMLKTDSNTEVTNPMTGPAANADDVVNTDLGNDVFESNESGVIIDGDINGDGIADTQNTIPKNEAADSNITGADTNTQSDIKSNDELQAEYEAALQEAQARSEVANRDFASDNTVVLPTDENGNIYTGHGRINPTDKYEELSEGLHKSAVHNDPEVQSMILDNALIQVGQFTGNDFIAAAAHEWHFYTKSGNQVTQIEPGGEAFYHIDSDYFSAESNKKAETSKKNGQVVFYAKNMTDTPISVLDCTVYKVYVSYAVNGIDSYSEIPIVDYFGLQIMDSAAGIQDNSYFGNCRTSSQVGETNITRYEYGAMEETSVWLDVMPTSQGDIFAGITISCLI